MKLYVLCFAFFDIESQCITFCPVENWARVSAKGEFMRHAFSCS